MTVVETSRLNVRHFTSDDAEFILHLLNEPTVLRFIGDRGVRTLHHAREYIAKGPVESYQRNGFGLCAVVLKSRGAPIGICGVMKKEWLPYPDIAYAFLPEYRSQGYGREAAAAVLDHARQTWQLNRVLAVVTPDNSASIRLLEKLGFIFREMVLEPGTGTELSLLASILKSSPQPITTLTFDDVPKVVDVLAAAFHEYPVMRYILGTDADNYDHRLNRLVELFVMARALRAEPMIGIYSGSELCAAATLSYPAVGETPPGFTALSQEIWSELGHAARERYDRCVTAWAPLSVNVPQIHVNMIGVRRAFQGSGLARRLLDQVHELSRGSPASEGVTLTTEVRANADLYRHLGYEIVGHVQVTPQLESWGFFHADHISRSTEYEHPLQT